MHTRSVIGVVALLSVSLTSASFCGNRDNDIPKCAKGCFNNPPTRQCGNDAACYCRSAWMNDLECCAQDACNDKDTSTFNTIVYQVCRSYGVQVALTCPATSSTLATSTPKTSSTAAGVSTTPASSTPASTNAQTTSAGPSPAISTAAAATTSSANACTCGGGGGGGGSGGSSSAPGPQPYNTQTGPASSATQTGGGGGGGSGSKTNTGPASSITQTTIPPSSAPSPANPTTLSTILSSATATLPTKPTTVPAVGAYTYQGCYTEATNGNRALNETRYIDPATMTVEKCVGFCQDTGMKWAGVEWTQECWCGDQMQFVNGAVKLGSALESACGLPCVGDATELCGGWAVLGVYQAS